ncbi:MAG: DUF6259 domain-containing protein [Capsulimonadaceae bacterium]|nr:DUF6259 domain-containing protein [Capsulimonadaceae bacterium]
MLQLAAGRRIAPTDATGVSCKRNGGRLEFIWSGFDGFSPDAMVKVVWTVKNGRLSGSLSIGGYDPDLKIEQICFPVFDLSFLGDCGITLPHFQGLLFSDIKANYLKSGHRLSGGYLNDFNMQFYSLLLDSGGGVYFDTHDTQGFVKGFICESGENAGIVRCSLTHPSPQTGSDGTFTMPYESGIQAFSGTWHDAAHVYRSWARRQRWAVGAEKRLKAWAPLDDISLWLWNRGSSQNVVPPALEAQRRIGAPVALDWYWWHSHCYDSDYPNYLPPREGEEKFKEVMETLRNAGIFSQVYTNGMLIDMSVPSLRKIGAKEVVEQADGSLKGNVFNVYTNRMLSFICGGGKLFSNKLSATAKRLRELGLQGLYLDQISCCSNNLCFSQLHGHAPGNGPYQIKGFRRLISRIRRENPGMPLSSEDLGEIFMDVLDSNIDMAGSSFERMDWLPFNAEPIPLFKAVYGPLCRIYGNYALIDGVPPYDPMWPSDGKWKADQERDWRQICPDQFRLEIARTVIYGLQPTVANLRACHFENAAFKDDIDFLIESARFYHRNRNLFLQGELLQPGVMKCETREVSFLMRMIFTKPEKAAVRLKSVRALIHSAWRGCDGEEALTVANYSQDAQSFGWSDGIHTVKGEIPPRSFAKYALGEDVNR